MTAKNSDRKGLCKSAATSNNGWINTTKGAWLSDFLSLEIYPYIWKKIMQLTQLLFVWQYQGWFVDVGVSKKCCLCVRGSTKNGRRHHCKWLLCFLLYITASQHHQPVILLNLFLMYLYLRCFCICTCCIFCICNAVLLYLWQEQKWWPDSGH